MARSNKKIKELVVRLREELPPLLPVRVYIRDYISAPGVTTVTSWLGACSLKLKDDKPSHFVIEIVKGNQQLMIDTLMHEWAHAISWRHNRLTVSDHDPEWALAYSRVYQLLIEH